MVLIIAVHFEGGEKHEHISMVKWHAGYNSDICSCDELIHWIKKGNKAYSSDGTNIAEVMIVDSGRPHLRAFSNGRWTDHLLSLPVF